MPEGVAALLVAVAALGPLAGLALGWWLHERVRPLVEAQAGPQTERQAYDEMLLPADRRGFALSQARTWSELAKADREGMEGRRAG